MQWSPSPSDSSSSSPSSSSPLSSWRGPASESTWPCCPGVKESGLATACAIGLATACAIGLATACAIGRGFADRIGSPLHLSDTDGSDTAIGETSRDDVAKADVVWSDLLGDLSEKCLGGGRPVWAPLATRAW
eukprot:6172817-Pleurochrysis_carterae.AAC.1